MKLSTKQKEVIRLMRNGWRIRKEHKVTTRIQSIKPVLCKDESDNVEISGLVFGKLCDLNLVTKDHARTGNTFTFYTLTELSKTIEL